MKSSRTPFRYAHESIPREISSELLSTVIIDGSSIRSAPSRAKIAVTFVAVSQKSAASAKHSRVKPSRRRRTCSRGHPNRGRLLANHFERLDRFETANPLLRKLGELGLSSIT
jgi:hypothetical protein